MINREPKYIKPLTRDEMRELTIASREARIKACDPSTPQGFARFYTYYHGESITAPHSKWHYAIMEVLWIVIQNQGKIPAKYKTTIELSQDDKRITEIAIFSMRELGKTSMGKAFIEYLLCYDLRRYLNVDTYDDTNSERILFDVVFNLQMNKKIITDFGHLYTTQRSKTETDQKRIKDFITNKNVDQTIDGQIRVSAYTTQSPVRGRNHNDDRPDFLWLDDFETENTMFSEVRTTSVAGHISSFKGGLAQSGAIILYTGNVLTEYGNVQAIIDKAKVSNTIACFIIPIYTGEYLTGEIQWAERYVWTDEEALGTGKISIESIKSKMWTPEKGDQDFVKEMLCQPIDYASQEFKKKMFKYITWQELQAKQTVLYIIIDSGGSSKETQRRKHGEVDDTGITFIYVDRYGNWYLKAWGQKMDAKEIMEMIFTYDMGYKNLENIAIEETMFVEAIKPFYDIAKKERAQYPKLKFVKSGGRNKENRIRGLIPRYEAGTIFHIEGECNQLEDQLLRFPRAKHDDVSDAVAYGNDIVKIPKFDEPVNNRGFYEMEDEVTPFNQIGL